MQLGRISHRNPYGSCSTMNVGMRGISEDIQAKLQEIMASPDAFKYVAYAVGGLFLTFALMSSGSARGRR